MNPTRREVVAFLLFACPPSESRAYRELSRRPMMFGCERDHECDCPSDRTDGCAAALEYAANVPLIAVDDYTLDAGYQTRFEQEYIPMQLPIRLPTNRLPWKWSH